MNYEGIHDYVHTDEDAQAESTAQIRWVDLFGIDPTFAGSCEECHGTGTITIPCITCEP